MSRVASAHGAIGPNRAILKSKIMVFFVKTFCDGNHPDHNRTCAMRVLHEIDCPHHRVAVRFSREEFYLCDHHSRGCMVSFQGMVRILMKILKFVLIWEYLESDTY